MHMFWTQCWLAMPAAAHLPCEANQTLPPTCMLMTISAIYYQLLESCHAVCRPKPELSGCMRLESSLKFTRQSKEPLTWDLHQVCRTRPHAAGEVAKAAAGPETLPLRGRRRSLPRVHVLKSEVQPKAVPPAARINVARRKGTTTAGRHIQKNL